jgi:HEPN domain-containing protein
LVHQVGVESEIVKDTTKNWIAAADYDFKTAESLLKSRRKIYVVFMCHLAIEKMLKSIVSEKQEKLPPYTHNLVYLVGLCGLTVPEKLRDFIELLNDKSVPMRYPENVVKLEKQFSLASAKSYLKNTKEVIKWLKQDLAL